MGWVGHVGHPKKSDHIYIYIYIYIDLGHYSSTLKLINLYIILFIKQCTQFLLIQSSYFLKPILGLQCLIAINLLVEVLGDKDIVLQSDARRVVSYGKGKN